MRIIDKKHDFYDYLQDPTDTIVFDRRDSFTLTKDIVCQRVGVYSRYARCREEKDFKHVLLQSCCTFWLFLLEITERDNFNSAKNYKIEFIHTWRDYSKERKLLVLSSVDINGGLKYHYAGRRHYEAIYDKDYLIKNIDNVINYVHNNDTSYSSSIISKYIDHEGNERTIPILKPSGIDETMVDPVELFSSIEEYFSMEKTAAETREPKGATNNDKIIMHGFDTKTSFRGKSK